LRELTGSPATPMFETAPLTVSPFPRSQTVIHTPIRFPQPAEMIGSDYFSESMSPARVAPVPRRNAPRIVRTLSPERVAPVPRRNAPRRVRPTDFARLAGKKK